MQDFIFFLTDHARGLRGGMKLLGGEGSLQFFSMLKYRMTDNLGAAADLMLITTVELMPIASDS